jgi:glycerol-3-phosphate acyltransferase PlsY
MIPMSIPVLIAYLVASYLIGAIPTGYVVAKKLKGIDIREHGSGNVGATNVRRVVGKKAGLFVLIFDFFKGFVPVFVAPYLVPEMPEEWRIAIALAASVGHSRSIFLGFTGGKAAITTLGGLFALEPLAGVLIGLMAFLIIKVTRFVSLGSITAAFTAPILLYVMDAHWSHIVFAIFGACFIIYLHRANIGRLIKGTENRI